MAASGCKVLKHLTLVLSRSVDLGRSCTSLHHRQATFSRAHAMGKFQVGGVKWCRPELTKACSE